MQQGCWACGSWTNEEVFSCSGLSSCGIFLWSVSWGQYPWSKTTHDAHSLTINSSWVFSENAETCPPGSQGQELEVWRDTEVTSKEVFLTEYNKLCSISWIYRIELTRPASSCGDNASVCHRLTHKPLNKAQHCTASSHLCKATSRLCWPRQRLLLYSCPVRLPAS